VALQPMYWLIVPQDWMKIDQTKVWKLVLVVKPFNTVTMER
jgi:hypothetical protein